MYSSTRPGSTQPRKRKRPAKTTPSTPPWSPRGPSGSGTPRKPKPASKRPPRGKKAPGITLF